MRSIAGWGGVPRMAPPPRGFNVKEREEREREREMTRERERD